MSLKSIDLQLSVSRTVDVGQLQSQQAQKPVGDQAAAAMQSMKERELERTKSTRTEKPSDGKIRDKADRDGGGESGGQAEDGGAQGERRQKPREAKHPFKGKYIDLSL